MNDSYRGSKDTPTVPPIPTLGAALLAEVTGCKNEDKPSPKLCDTLDINAWTVASGQDLDKPQKVKLNESQFFKFNEMGQHDPEYTKTVLPTDPQERKGYPVASGVVDYFPAALVEIAKVSKAGNDQHNPGEPLHWARGKSMDQADTIMRHFIERGTYDSDGLRHSAKLAWRALALLQLECERDGAPIPRGAK